MFDTLLRAWLVALLLAVVEQAGAAQVGNMTSSQCMQQWKAKWEKPWESLVRSLGEGIETLHNETILLRPVVLEKIKDENFYDCVMKEILGFYMKVFFKQGENCRDVGHLTEHLRQCVMPVSCPKLCKRLSRKAKTTAMNKENIAELTPKNLAILQLQKLQEAQKQLADVKTQEKALVELQSVVFFLPNEKVDTDPKCPQKQKKKKDKRRKKCN